MGGHFDSMSAGVYGDPDSGGWDGQEEGRITAVTSKGATFVLTSAPLTSYGPAPWSLGSYATVALAITGGFAPHIGDRCLVGFAGTEHIPWILCWTR